MPRGLRHVSRLLARVLTVGLLVLDDFGLQPLSPQAAKTCMIAQRTV